MSLQTYREGIKISHILRGHCAACSRDREVGVVSCGWVASTVSISIMGWTGEYRGFVVEACCENSRSAIESVPYTHRARSKRPCDFFLWEYLKEKVFKHSPRSLEDVKERIQQELDSIPPELTRRVMKNFRNVFSSVLPPTAAICLILFLKTIKKLVFMYFSEIY